MAAPKIEMYTAGYCGFCQRAKTLLQSKGASWNEIHVDHDPEKRMEMVERSGRLTVPQIWVGERHVGGFDDLYALHRSGELDDLLESGDESTAA
ncbi:MAG: glutaredoxin 3 [Gammaproteobacteria bacterium]|nr:glutaredoxin 3 [Gammaproteobacteria bacterium]